MGNGHDTHTHTHACTHARTHVCTQIGQGAAQAGMLLSWAMGMTACRYTWRCNGCLHDTTKLPAHMQQIPGGLPQLKSLIRHGHSLGSEA